MNESTMWRVRLFDGPVLEGAAGEATTRFRSAKVQGLLAFLALRLGRPCPREEVADALWPNEPDAAVLANRLRVTLASLRRQLEPPGTPFGTVLDASVPGRVGLRETTVWCDVAAFERAYAAGRHDEAAALLRGPLLPGLYDEWVRTDQLRFEALREGLAGRTPPALAETAPASEPPSPSPHRLPLYLTRFVGGEAARASLVASLDESRLVTLTGPGGIGKTRLAVEAASQGRRPAVFVDLATLEDASRLAETVLRALGVRSRSDEAPEEGIRSALRARPPTLLILDNAEGFVEAVAELALRLLGDLPDLRLLVTSRQRLEVAGERVFAVAPLEPPGESSLEALARSPSAALFLDRARNAVPDFVAKDRHVEAIVAICRRLEGMPLALELAAARVAVQSPAGIVAALEANAMDLRSRQRGLSERHRSLRAAIQGSVETLAPPIRRLFARLAAFPGGWTAEAAAFVGDEPAAEAMLEELLVRSLVLAREDATGVGVRYAFLEPIRAFAQEALSPDEAEACRGRHAAYFLRLAALASEDDLRTLRPLDAEAENLRSALEAGPEAEGYWDGLAGALIHAFVRGHHRQAVRWIEASAPRVAQAPPALRFRWRYAAAQILPDVGRLDETDAIARAMRADAEATGDGPGAVYTLVILAYVVELRGGVEASLALSADALRRARATPSRHLLETALSHRGGALHVYASMVGGVEAEGALAEAEALARELCGLVPAHSRRGALGPLLLGEALWQQGRLEEAYAAFKEAEAAAVRLGTTTEPMYAFVSEAAIAAQWGFDDHAAEFYGAFLALQERIGYSLERAQSSRPPWIERLAVGLRERLGDEAFGRLVADGRAATAEGLVARWVIEKPGNDGAESLIHR